MQKSLVCSASRATESICSPLVPPLNPSSRNFFTHLQFAGLVSSTAIALTDNSGFGTNCTCTVNGKTYNAATVYITSASVSASQLSLNMTVYYGEQYTNPINITYTGNLK